MSLGLLCVWFLCTHNPAEADERERGVGKILGRKSGTDIVPMRMHWVAWQNNLEVLLNSSG